MHPAFSVPFGGRLRWAHAANTERHLRVALADPSVDAVEADVCILPSSGAERKAYIAHPPAGESAPAKRLDVGEVRINDGSASYQRFRAVNPTLVAGTRQR